MNRLFKDLDFNWEVWLINLLAAVYFFILLITLTKNLGKGLDITDDSFYILWARQPDNINGVVTPFGYYTRFLYKMAGESIALFRLLGAAFLFATSLLFALLFSKTIRQNYGRKNDEVGIVFILVGTAFAYYFHRWMPTPSYNWLALIGCLLVGSGLLLLRLSRDSNQIQLVLAGCLVGLGGGVAFMAKPTTAMVLSITALWWVAVHWKRAQSLRFVSTASLVCTILLGYHVWIEIGGLSLFMNKFQLGIQQIAALQSGHNLYSMVREFTWDTSRYAVAGGVLGWLSQVLLNGKTFTPWRKSGNHKFSVCILCSTVALAICALCILWIKPNKYPAVAYFGFIVSLLTLSFFSDKKMQGNTDKYAVKKTIQILNKDLLVLVSLCILLNFSYGFGTQVGFFHLNSSAIIFLAAACFLISKRIDSIFETNKITVVVVLFIVSTVSIFSIDEYKNPYRLSGSLRNQSVIANFFDNHDSLHVNKVTAKYIADLVSMAKENGWQAGMPLVDSTGGTPGALVILQAKLLGSAWLLGNYKGSNEVASLVLQEVDKQELAKAWILVAPNGRRQLDLDHLFTKIGINFPQDYSMIGEAVTGLRKERQQLWKPL